MILLDMNVLIYASTEDEAVAEDTAAFEDRTQTVMEIPTALVPAVWELIARHGR